MSAWRDSNLLRVVGVLFLGFAAARDFLAAPAKPWRAVWYLLASAALLAVLRADRRSILALTPGRRLLAAAAFIGSFVIVTFGATQTAAYVAYVLLLLPVALALSATRPRLPK